MRIKQKFLGWAMVMLTVLCCAGLLFLPKICVSHSADKLFENFYPRPAIEGMLDEEAQEIPIAYALYQKRYLGTDSSYTGLDDENSSPEENNGAAELVLLSDLMTGLADSGVISPKNANLITQALELDDISATSDQESAGFYRLGLVASTGQDDKKDCRKAAVRLHGQTDKIVELTLSGFSVNEHAEQLITAYMQYLGVNALPDWQASPKNTKEKAFFWSPKGQLYLYCAVETDSFCFGALSLPDEEVKRFFQT